MAASPSAGDEPSLEAERYLTDLARRLGVPSLQRTVGEAADLAADPLIGRRIGSYRLLRILGRGGMGAVYLAERADGQFEKRVAVKLLPLAVASESAHQRFLLERQILAELEHPGIARLLDGGVTPEGVPYFILEYVDGTPVDVHCRVRGLGLRQRLDQFIAVCDVVAYAHRQRIVHRDIKPSNVLVDGAGRVKLLDFGVAKLLDQSEAGEDTTLTRLGGRPLTPRYAAPEQFRGTEPVTPATDVYALGALLYEVLTARPPLEAADGTPEQILEAIERTEPGRLSRRIAGSTDGPRSGPGDHALLRGLDAVAARALERNPAHRHASAEALSADLRRIMRGERPGGPGPLRRIARWTRRSKRRIHSAFLGAAAAVAAVSLAGFALASHRAEGTGPPAGEAAAVTILPFDYRGGEEHAYLRSGIADLLQIKLSGSRSLRAAAPAVVSDLPGSGPAPVRATAAAGGAAYYLGGRVTNLGGEVRIEGALYGSGDGRALLAEHVEEAPGPDVLDAVDRVADRLLRAVPGVTAQDLSPLELTTSSSLEAVKAFLAGEAAVRRSDWALALDRFERATTLDSLFSLAHFRLGVAAGRALQQPRREEVQRSALARALRTTDRLPLRIRPLVAAYHERHFGSAERAASSFRRIVAADPDNAEAWYQLGETLAHDGFHFGRPKTDAIEPFLRTLELDPDHAGALDHIAELAPIAGRPELVASTVGAAADWAALPIKSRTAAAFFGEDEAAKERVLEELGSLPPWRLHAAAWSLVGTRRYELMLPAFALLTGPDRPDAERALGWAFRGIVPLMRGRWEAARRSFARAAELEGEPLPVFLAREWDMLISWANPVPFFPEEVLRDAERALDAREMVLPRDIRLLAIRGRIQGHLGKSVEAEAVARRLEEMSHPGHDGQGLELARTVRLASAFADGRDADVLRLTGDSLVVFGAEATTRAEALYRLDRHDEAETLFRIILSDKLFTFWYHADFRLGEIHERRGEREEARRHFRRVVEAFQDADQHLRPLRDRAARRAETLASRSLTR